MPRTWWCCREGWGTPPAPIGYASAWSLGSHAGDEWTALIPDTLGADYATEWWPLSLHVPGDSATSLHRLAAFLHLPHGLAMRADMEQVVNELQLWDVFTPPGKTPNPHRFLFQAMKVFDKLASLPLQQKLPYGIMPQFLFDGTVRERMEGDRVKTGEREYVHAVDAALVLKRIHQKLILRKDDNKPVIMSHQYFTDPLKFAKTFQESTGRKISRYHLYKVVAWLENAGYIRKFMRTGLTRGSKSRWDMTAYELGDRPVGLPKGLQRAFVEARNRGGQEGAAHSSGGV